jgi:Ca2+-binding RTX toxin-like protein
MAGGGGQDFYQVDNLFDKVVEGVGQGDDGVISQVDHFLSENVERLYLEGTAVTGYGNKLGNLIQGNAQNNKFAGFEGNDTLFGGFGGEADTMYGGAGDDTYYVDSLSDTVDETVGAGGSGKDTIIATIDVPGLPDAIENLKLQGSAVSGIGNAQNNRIEGNGSGNILSGLVGADTLIGDSGDDTLNGGDGADSMVGGDGGDDYYVNNAGDKVVEAASSGSDWVYADVNYTLAANVEHLLLLNAVNGTGNGLDNFLFGNGFANKLAGLGGNDTIDGGTATDTLDGGDGNDSLVGGTENDSLLGGNGLDTLDGGSGADTLVGGAGNDFLVGGTGVDSTAGGAGNDFYIVDNTLDVIVESVGQGTDLVLSSASSFTLANNVENLNLSNTAVTGIGNGLNNVISAAEIGTTANKLEGAAGNDTLDGVGGADTLAGGTGRDTFLIRATDAIDSVTDFEAGPLGDTLDLSELLTGYTVGVSDANDFVQFTNLGGKTQVFVDQNGAVGGASFVEVAELDGVILSNINQAVLEGNLQLD